MEAACCICWDGLHSGTDTVEANTCGHSFHGKCIRQAIKVKQSCPQCRERCTPHTLLKLFLDTRPLDGATQVAPALGRGSSSRGYSEVEVIDLDDVPDSSNTTSNREQVEVLTREMTALQRRLQLAAQQMTSTSATAALQKAEFEAHANSLKSDIQVLSGEVRKLTEENRAMKNENQLFVLKQGTFRDKISHLDAELKQEKIRASQLQDQVSKLEAEAESATIYTDRTLDAQELLRIATKNPQATLKALAQSVSLLNKQHGELVAKVEKFSKERHDMERKMTTYQAKYQAAEQSRKELFERVRVMKEERAACSSVAQETGAEDCGEVGPGASAAETAGDIHIHLHEPYGGSAPHTADTQVEVAVRRNQAAAAHNSSRPTSTFGSSLRSSVPSFMSRSSMQPQRQTGSHADVQGDKGKYILSGADGRGGRTTVFKRTLFEKPQTGADNSGQRKKTKLDTPIFSALKNRTNQMSSFSGVPKRDKMASSEANNSLKIGHFFSST